MRRGIRSLLLLAHVGLGLAMAMAVCLEGGRRLPRERMAGWWHRRLLRILHLHLRVLGSPGAGPRLLVCNHVSWLDIPVIGAVEPTRFVSKAEVRHWPIAGWLATGAGSFYLQRGAGGTRELVAALAAYLSSGSVTLFPEGTTTPGDRVLRFAPRLFAAAIEAGCPVQPLALRYGRGRGGRSVAPFVGDDALLGHLWRLLREPSIEVELIYGPPIQSRGAERAALAQAAHAAVTAAVEGRMIDAPKIASLAA